MTYNLGVPIGKNKTEQKKKKKTQKQTKKNVGIRHPLSSEKESGIHYLKSAIHSVEFRTHGK